VPAGPDPAAVHATAVCRLHRYMGAAQRLLFNSGSADPTAARTHPDTPESEPACLVGEDRVSGSVGLE